MVKKIFIVGSFQEIIDLAEECGHEIIGLIDDSPTQGSFPYPTLCDDEGIDEALDLLQGAAAVLTPDSPETRARLYDFYTLRGFRFASLISPGAKIAKSAIFAEGIIVHWNAHVSAGSVLGRCVRLNTGANVMHDSVIGDFTTIAPNAVVLGRVQIGAGCYIGSNSTILPGLSIGERSIIGAGSVVTKNVPPNVVVLGNPARVM